MKYLLISHDATRTGAPILLLNLAKLILKKEPNSVAFLLKNGGVLQPDFIAIGPTYYANQKVVHSFFSRFNIHRKTTITDPLFLDQFDYIISNTITNGDILHIIRKNFKGKIVTYIHELEIASKTYTTSNEISVVMESSNSFWVPSTLVKDFIINTFKITTDRIAIMPYSIRASFSEKLKTESHLKPFVVGGCGTVDWRKGPDLFLFVAKRVLEKRQNAKIFFKWVGASNGIELERLNYQIRKLNIADKIIFETTESDLSYFYNSIDLFLLTSREDPYPLVVLEAASYGVPTLCFDAVCGSKDFINESNGGSIVPFLDIESMADSILHYYDSNELLTLQGTNAKMHLSKTHSDDNYVYSEFKNHLSKITI